MTPPMIAPVFDFDPLSMPVEDVLALPPELVSDADGSPPAVDFEVLVSSVGEMR